MLYLDKNKNKNKKLFAFSGLHWETVMNSSWHLMSKFQMPWWIHDHKLKAALINILILTMYQTIMCNLTCLQMNVALCLVKV